MITMTEFAKKSTSEELRKRIKEILRHREMSQAELAMKTGIPTSTLSRFLIRRSQGIKLELIWKIADALNMTIEELILGPDAVRKQRTLEGNDEILLLLYYRKLEQKERDSILQIIMKLAESAEEEARKAAT